MNSMKLPGPLVEAQLMGPHWVVFFHHIPWPSAFPAEVVASLGGDEAAFMQLWQERHEPLSHPSPLMESLLKTLRPYQNYASGDVLRSFIQSGYAYDDLAKEQIVERLQLMPFWNGWRCQRHPGFFWIFGKHHGFDAQLPPDMIDDGLQYSSPS